MVTHPPPIPPEIVPLRLSEDAYIALRKLEYDHALASLGLQGTLWGTIGCLITILAIVLLPAFSPLAVVQRWEVVGVVGAFVLPVVFYGSFVFSRALKVSAKIDKAGGAFEGSTGERSPGESTVPKL
jgi:hypothetical protein